MHETNDSESPFNTKISYDYERIENFKSASKGVHSITLVSMTWIFFRIPLPQHIPFVFLWEVCQLSLDRIRRGEASIVYERKGGIPRRSTSHVSQGPVRYISRYSQRQTISSDSGATGLHKHSSNIPHFGLALFSMLFGLSVLGCWNGWI